MELDQETLADLSIFDREENQSVFGILNFTVTDGGRARLYEIFRHPLAGIPQIEKVQNTVRYLYERPEIWPLMINNGTIMVVEQFLKDAPGEVPPLNTGPLSGLNNLFYRLFLSDVYAALRFSLAHIHTFLVGMNQFIDDQSLTNDIPELLKKEADLIGVLINRQEVRQFIRGFKIGKSTVGKVIKFGHFMKGRHRDVLARLLKVYYQLDAWHSMALALKNLNLSFPQFIKDSSPVIHAGKLYHLLLKNPVAYDIRMDKDTNFLFLTGANMSGKSTFIKSIGLAVYLAHLGMGVPAEKMELTYFDGMISNIKVQDNIFLGESYFFNEVQRIKKTILKIHNDKKWLVLIDEMFKGTNFQDAKQCSLMVIQGLLKMRTSLFVLSTHLYEIAEPLRGYPNISFRYFETSVENEEPKYNYQLQEGISNDRLGFLILKREKVLDLLDRI